MNIISDYIITLMQNIEIILEKKAFDCYANSHSSVSTSFRKENKKIIEFDHVKNTFNDIRDKIKSITKNEYQFIKQCEDYFDYNSPEEIVVSSPNEFPENGYFLPVDKTLLSMLKYQPFITRILENIQNQHTAAEHDDDLMFSIRNGHHGNRLDQDTLLIQLYLDDISLTNPLGSKRDLHKLCMVYFTLEDIPDECRSKIDFIQLVGICESKFLKDTTKAKRFFQPIVDNLNNLQLHADNLAAHMIGGFQSCFNTGKFCRRCCINYEDRNLPLPLSHVKVRTVVDHDKTVQEIKSNPNKSSLMGVVGESPLHELIGFHPILSLPGDLMHDFIEDVWPIIIMSRLKQASSMRLITYGRKQFLFTVTIWISVIIV
ncbi:unnamed protein product [Rotaria magnacalcarata]|uniref:Uncharacterized protein n=1 Tax=Rotaria magnacalcarata TaxID=392030 RepID=A0A8S2ZAW3_9BILA|nr:unnamed protein product [Rotaria magnacalcarata]